MKYTYIVSLQQAWLFIAHGMQLDNYHDRSLNLF